MQRDSEPRYLSFKHDYIFRSPYRYACVPCSNLCRLYIKPNCIASLFLQQLTPRLFLQQLTPRYLLLYPILNITSHLNNPLAVPFPASTALGAASTPKNPLLLASHTPRPLTYQPHGSSSPPVSSSRASHLAPDALLHMPVQFAVSIFGNNVLSPPTDPLNA